MRWIFILCLIWTQAAPAQNNLPPLGQWREHLPYQNLIDAAASSEKIYAATPYALFSVALTTKEIERYSRVSGLSETGISTLAFDEAAQKLYVAYTNSNLDVLGKKGIRNIPYLKRENTSGDKSIYQIHPQNNLVFLSTGLGVVVVDAIKEEVQGIWRVGRNGGAVKTEAFALHDGFYYAATAEGLKRAPQNSNPALFQNWQQLSGANGLALAPCRSVVNAGGTLIALQNDSLFVLRGGSWQVLFANNYGITRLNASGSQLLVCQRTGAGASQVVVLQNSGTVLRILQQPEVISFPLQALAAGNKYWVADLYGGLSEWSPSGYELHRPNAPFDLTLGSLTVHKGKVYAPAGSVNASWNYQYNRSGLMRLDGGSWDVINQYRFPQLDSVLDLITVAVDPKDGAVWAGSYGGGLLHIQDNSVRIFKQNTSLEAAVGDPGSYRVSGLAFDSRQNLWVSNFGAARPLHVRKPDGSWRAFSVPFNLFAQALSQLLVDEADRIWMASPLGGGLIVFNPNQTPDNPADDQWRLFGAGSLPSAQVLSLATDRNGFIWVGTANGVAVLQCADEVFTNNCQPSLPVIQEGGFASFLFKGQEVRSIAVDGANRKWMATSDGVWLIAPDGDKVLQHFTVANSPLPDNDVRSIAIDEATGEVFFATTKGLISYRGEATTATKGDEPNVLVFPNPVPPAYTGQIAVRGLPENSLVKIMEPNGRLVYQTRSLGGQAVWNGRDYQGRRPATGIYLVMAIGADKKENVVAKIAFIGGS